MENRFNLLDEPWIPIADVGLVSLKQVFANPSYRGLGGNPVQKIALMKLLLAIAQAAQTPADEQEWKTLGAEGLAQCCLAYLEQWRERFYLYGEQPFLQMPAVEVLIKKRTEKRLSAVKTAGKIIEIEFTGAPKCFGAGFYPDLPSKNNTMLSHTLFNREQSNAEQALFILTLMNFAFGGKRVESDMNSLAGSEMGNLYSAPAAPSLGGWVGQLHCFPVTGVLQVDIWANMLTHSHIDKLNRWPQGLGVPPWECMPKTESDVVATKHKETYQACLLALSRFVLLKNAGIYYLDGLQYPSIKEGWFEPSLVLNGAGKEISVKYADPEKRPWRELQSLLSFIGADSSSGFECFILNNGLNRLGEHCEKFAVWSGGLRVRANSGDQSVKQSDDFVESLVWLNSRDLGESWFAHLKHEMDALDGLAKGLYGRVMGFFKEQKVDGGKLATQATQLFWQLCERNFQSLLDNCNADEQGQLARQGLRKTFAGYVQQAYDQFCPKASARQLDAWAKNRPNNSKYLQQEA